MLKRLTSFSIRELILVTAIVALALALWITAKKVPDSSNRPGAPVGGVKTVVEGPLVISYRERTSPNSTTGSNGVNLKALYFLEDAVIFEYQRGRFRRYESSRLEDLEWRIAK